MHSPPKFKRWKWFTRQSDTLWVVRGQFGVMYCSILFNYKWQNLWENYWASLSITYLGMWRKMCRTAADKRKLQKFHLKRLLQYWLKVIARAFQHLCLPSYKHKLTRWPWLWFFFFFFFWSGQRMYSIINCVFGEQL